MSRYWAFELIHSIDTSIEGGKTIYAGQGFLKRDMLITVTSLLLNVVIYIRHRAAGGWKSTGTTNNN